MRPCLVIALILVAFGATAEQSLNAKMRRISDSMLILLPQVHDPASRRNEIRRDLQRLQILVNDAGEHVAGLPIGSRLNYSMLQRQLANAETSLDNGSLYMMKGAMANAFELCAGCHSLDDVQQPAFGISRLRELDEYMAGEYSYLTRDPEGAMESYTSYLRGKSPEPTKRNHVLLRMFSLQVHAGQADEWIASARKKSWLTAEERSMLAGWSKVLDRVDGENGGMLSPTSTDSVSALDQLLGSEWPEIRFMLNYDEQQAYWILVREQLNRFLADASADEDNLPVILYWLGVSDRYLRYQFYESLAGQYLEECIRDFPAHPYARTCYDEYELLMIVSYSGSGGLRLPQDVIDNLSALRDLLR